MGCMQGGSLTPTTQMEKLKSTEEQGAAQGHRVAGSPKLSTQAWQLHPPQLLPAQKALDRLGTGEGAGRRALRRGEDKPSQGTGRAFWGCGRIISQTQGLALSPLWFKKHLIRLQGPESLSQESPGPHFPLLYHCL